MLNRSFNGIWFFGLSGAGKTYASTISKISMTKSFIIDGDEVRKHISSDLGYTKEDREVQLRRILGLAQIVISNGYYPIISSVYMTREIAREAVLEKIAFVEVTRPLAEIRKIRPLYTENSNVVGVDFFSDSIDCMKIANTGDKKFQTEIENVIARLGTQDER